MMRSILKLFRSSTLVLVLLALIIAASIAGTLIQQNAALEVYSASYGPMLAGLFRTAGLTDVYHAWWFIALLVLLSINIIVCSFSRITKTISLVRGTGIIVKKEYITGLKNTASFRYAGSINDLVRSFNKKHYNTRKTVVRDTTYILAEKGVPGRFGSFITHMSIIVILIGALIGSLWGFKTNVSINEGETVAVPHRDFKIRLDSFDLEFYGETRRPKDYKSTLTIIRDEKEILTKTIEVNDPLKYEGIFFYQSTYGQSAQPETIVIHTDKNPSEHGKEATCVADYTLKIGEQFSIPGTEYRVHVLRYVADFLIDEHHRIISRSNEPNNPAVNLSVHENDRLLFDVWSFPRIGVPYFPENFNYNFFLKDMSFKTFSGLQVTYDPGVYVVWTGCGMLMTGLLFSFYLIHRRIWVMHIPTGKDGMVYIGGNAGKNQYSFTLEFDRLIKKIKGDA